MFYKNFGALSLGNVRKNEYTSPLPTKIISKLTHTNTHTIPSLSIGDVQLCDPARQRRVGHQMKM